MSVRPSIFLTLYIREGIIYMPRPGTRNMFDSEGTARDRRKRARIAHYTLLVTTQQNQKTRKPKSGHRFEAVF